MVAPATNGIWKRFVKAIGRNDLLKDPKLANDMDRFKNGAIIDQIVGAWVKERKADEAISLLQKARIPCTVINTVDQLLTDPQVEARNMIVHLDYPQLGKIPIPGIPINLSLTPGSIRAPAPKLGEHNEEIYCGLLGLSSEEFSRLKQKGII
jgi:crotonobetainyl-CoA:carnitine CoA-transferase CaiB-like acyl-CoA transferase